MFVFRGLHTKPEERDGSASGRGMRSGDGQEEARQGAGEGGIHGRRPQRGTQGPAQAPPRHRLMGPESWAASSRPPHSGAPSQGQSAAGLDAERPSAE